MAWMFWLLAPVCATTAGALLVWWRGRSMGGGRRRRGGAISEHRALLQALASCRRDEDLPVNLVVLDAPADRAPATGS